MPSEEDQIPKNYDGEVNRNSKQLENNGEENNGAFRIRDIAEINSTIVNAASQEEQSASNVGAKRKLPVWLGSPVADDNKKKTRKENPGNSKPNGLPTTPKKIVQQSENPVIKQEPHSSGLDADVGSSSDVTGEVNEPAEENPSATDGGADTMDENLSSSEADASTDVKIKQEIKEEVDDEDEEAEAAASTSSNTPAPVPARTPAKKQTPAVKQEATSTVRDSCKFGIRCYRRNPAHRAEQAHPGDSDYRRPDYPSPPKGTPDCPYGDKCYRRNPVHFQQYSHPPSTDFKKNWRLRQKRLRKQKKDPNYVYYKDDDESDLDEEEDEDPFASDGSSDEYIPSDDN